MSRAIVITSREYYKLFLDESLLRIDIPKTLTYFKDSLCQGFRNGGVSLWDELGIIFSQDPKASESNYQKFWAHPDHSEQSLKLLAIEIGETVLFVFPCMPVNYDHTKHFPGDSNTNIRLRHSFLSSLLQDVRAYKEFDELFIFAHDKDLYSANLDRLFKDTDLIDGDDPLVEYSGKIYGFMHTDNSRVFPIIEKGTLITDADIHSILNVFPAESGVISILKKIDNYPFSNSPKPDYEGLMGLIKRLVSAKNSDNV